MRPRGFSLLKLLYELFQEADYLLSSTIGTSTRFQYVDYPSCWYYGPFGTIVPYPKDKLDFSAPLKPFSFKVQHTYIFVFLIRNRCVLIMIVFILL